MNHAMESLAEVNAELMTAAPSRYRELLAKRRAALDTLADRQAAPCGAEELAAALRSGHDAHSRLLVELGALRDKIEDLRRLRAGLGQLRPTHTTPPSLDVRL